MPRVAILAARWRRCGGFHLLEPWAMPLGHVPPVSSSYQFSGAYLLFLCLGSSGLVCLSTKQSCSILEHATVGKGSGILCFSRTIWSIVIPPIPRRCSQVFVGRVLTMVFRQLGRPLLGVGVRLPLPSPSRSSAAGRYCPWSRVTFRPWAVSPWESFLAPLYSTLLISPNFLGKAENPEDKGTPKLKVSLRDPCITLH